MRVVRDLMGMPITVDVRDPDPPASAVAEAFADLAAVDQTFSPFVAESAVSRINAGRLQPSEAEPLVQEVLALCRRYERATDGYFAAWIAGRLDPSGLVKGWAIARACAILDRHGCQNYFVDAGGDVQTRGWSEPRVPWRVGIRHPVEKDKVTRVIRATGLGVATSGTYEKGAHILDPHTGHPATELLCMTVVGPDILEADVYATAAFAMGRRGLDFIERLPGLEAYAIGPDLVASWTAGFDAYCEAAAPARGVRRT